MSNSAKSIVTKNQDLTWSIPGPYRFVIDNKHNPVLIFPYCSNPTDSLITIDGDDFLSLADKN